MWGVYMTFVIIVLVLLVGGVIIYKTKFDPSNVTHAVYDVNDVPE